MTDAWKKVRVGDQLNIPAEVWNTFIDLARPRQQSSGTDGEPFRAPQRSAVKVRNSTSSDRDQFDVLGLSAPLVLSTENETEFKTRVAFDCVDPTTASHIGKYCVLLEAIPAGEIGWACVSGVTQVRLRVPASLESFAEIANLDADALTCSATGTARILWAETSGTERWAIVRLGDGAGGAAGGGVTAEEVDGTPSYASTTTLRFDQADGFVLSQPGAGIARVDLASASTTQKGIVDLSYQQFEGTKEFLDIPFVNVGFTMESLGESNVPTLETYIQGDTSSGEVGRHAQYFYVGSTEKYHQLLSLDTTAGGGSLLAFAAVAAVSPLAVSFSGGDVSLTLGGSPTLTMGSTSFYTAGRPVISSSAPASASASGTAGHIAYDSSYLYICTAANTWKRVAIATW